MSQISASSFQVVVIDITTPGTAEQVASFIVPEGMEVVVTARAENAQNMFVADSKTNAQTDGSRKELVPGQSFRLQINNTNLIWVDAQGSTDQLEILVQRIPSTGG